MLGRECYSTGNDENSTIRPNLDMKFRLLDMMETDDIDRVQELLQTGLQVNEKDEHGNTALMLASEKGFAGMTGFLLSYGADVNARDTADNIPLYYACLSLKDKENIAHLLLDHGADARARNRIGITVLHAACLYGTSVALRLIRAGAGPETEDLEATTPYHIACSTGNTEVIRFLLERGVKGTANRNGLSPLDCVMKLPPSNPAREEILDLFRQYAPEVVMEAYCSQGPGG